VKTVTRAALAAACTTAMFGALAVPGGAASAADGVTVVATDFAGPLHLAVSPTGALIVADAFAGTIEMLDPATGQKSSVVSEQGFTPGVGVQGQQFFYPLSTGSETESGDALLMRTNPSGQRREVADLLAYELDKNPDGQPQGTGLDADSNPYAVLALPGRVLVADAAGNDIVEVRPNGAVRTLTVFPVSRKGDCATAENNGVANGGCDPTPTDLAYRDDGLLFVSGLGGEAEGHIWVVDASTGAIRDHIDGFPPLTGIALGPDGTVYASSLFAGLIFRHSPEGEDSVAEVPGAADVTVGRDGTLYATTVDFEGGPGSVVAVAPSAFH
jgi:hypothetical protein